MRYVNFGEDVRVRYRKEYQSFYKVLVGDREAKSEGLLFSENGELFIFCANLGLKYGKKSESDKLQNATDFRFSSMKNEELRAYYLIVGMLGGEGMKYESFDQAYKLKNSVELYADAGMEIFYEKFLKDYFIFRDGRYHFLGANQNADFEKNWLVFLHEEIN